jgi:hypothetical protein
MPNAVTKRLSFLTVVMAVQPAVISGGRCRVSSFEGLRIDLSLSCRMYSHVHYDTCSPQQVTENTNKPKINGTNFC